MNNLETLIQKIKQGDDITIQFVGDSITYGLNHCKINETYVANFATLLAAELESYSVYRYDGVMNGELLPMERFDGPILVSKGKGEGRIYVIKNGIGGNTVMRAYNRIGDFTGTLVNGKRPDVTFMMFGINDALKSDASKYVDTDTFKSNYKMLLDEVRRRNPETLIIIMSATTNDQTIEAHCEKTAELVKEENIPYIDLHKLWNDHYRADAENFGHGDWLAGGADACHPTPKATAIMAKYIFDDFIKIISD